MADRRRGKQRKQQDITEKPTKDETAVAKFMRFKVPTKDAKLVGLPVKYFIGAEAVKCLLESKWSASKNKSSPLFTNKASCVNFCQTLLMKGMFHRASKVERKKDKSKSKKKKGGKDEAEESSKKDEEKSKKEKKSKSSKKSEVAEKKDDSEEDKKEDEKDNEKDKDDKKDEEKKKKRKEKKVKLEMADNQIFQDGEDDIYVWIYDPVPFKTFIIGLFLVLGAVGVCLFPLWPPEVRLGVYYLSLAVAGLIGVLLSLCVVRVILFGFVWLLTLGRHYFWLFPNINEDVGFIDSFRPLYHHEYVSQSWGASTDDKSDSKSDKDKDKTDENDEAKDSENKASEENNTEDKKCDEDGSENDYEKIEKEECEEDEEEDEENTESKKDK